MRFDPGYCALTPFLQFNNIPFRVSRIHNAKSTDAIYFGRCDGSYCAAAARYERLQCLIHVLDPKRNVSEPARVRCRQFALD
jgi:hypothetical protein